MEIGKLEAVFTSDPVTVERARLEREVIEAAKKWRAAELNSSRDLINAVDKLYYFESQHGIETKD